MNKENIIINAGLKDLNKGQDEKEIKFLLEQIAVLKCKNKQLQSQLSEKDKELSELKAKHNEDINHLMVLLQNRDAYIYQLEKK